MTVVVAVAAMVAASPADVSDAVIDGGMRTPPHCWDQAAHDSPYPRNGWVVVATVVGAAGVTAAV